MLQQPMCTAGNYLDASTVEALDSESDCAQKRWWMQLASVTWKKYQVSSGNGWDESPWNHHVCLQECLPDKAAAHHQHPDSCAQAKDMLNLWVFLLNFF